MIYIVVSHGMYSMHLARWVLVRVGGWCSTCCTEWVLSTCCTEWVLSGTKFGVIWVMFRILFRFAYQELQLNSLKHMIIYMSFCWLYERHTFKICFLINYIVIIRTGPAEFYVIYETSRPPYCVLTGSDRAAPLIARSKG